MGAIAVEVATSRVSSPSQSIREYVERMFVQKSAEGDNGLNHIFPDSLPPERGLVVSEVCRAIRPKATLEVGMAWGISTLLILEALTESGGPAAPHVVMDPFQSQSYHNAALLALRKLGIDNLVEFHEERSELFLPRLVAERRRFDFAFIDGDHDYEAAFTDFRFVHMMLDPGGTILFDDSFSDGVYLVMKYAEMVLGYRRLDLPCPVPSYYGRPAICAVVKPLQPVEREPWHAPIKPFFADLVPRRTTDLVKVVRTLGDPIVQLDHIDGDCRAAKILIKGGVMAPVEAALPRIDEASREIAEVVRVAEAFSCVAAPGRGAEVRGLLQSVQGAFKSAVVEHSPDLLDEALSKLARLKAIFANNAAPNVKTAE